MKDLKFYLVESYCFYNEKFCLIVVNYKKIIINALLLWVSNNVNYLDVFILETSIIR